MSRTVWLLAVVFYGIGDFVTTIAGVRHDDLEEGMALTRRLFGEEPSPLRFGLFKAGLLAGFYAGYRALAGRRYRVLVPAGIAAVGAYAVYNNVRVILGVRSGEKSE